MASNYGYGYQQHGSGTGYQQPGSGGYQQPGGGSGYQQPGSGSAYPTQPSGNSGLIQYPNPSAYPQSGSGYSNQWGYYGNQTTQYQYQPQQPAQNQYHQTAGQGAGRNQGGNTGGSWNPSSYGYGAGNTGTPPHQPPPQQQQYQQQQQQQQKSQEQGSGSANEEYQKYYYQSSLTPSQTGPSGQNVSSNPPLPFSSTLSSKNQQSNQAQSGYGGSKFVSAAKQYYDKRQQKNQSGNHDNQAYSQYLNAYISQSSQTVPNYHHHHHHHQQQQQQQHVPFKRKPPTDPTKFFCEPCKVACGSEQNFQAHIAGKAHQKKVSQPSTIPSIPGVVMYRCEVCTIMCSGKDALEAHLGGSKHKKSVKMLHLMNKAIPNPVATVITTEKGEDGTIHQKEEKADVQKGPQIKFVGGQHLTSTGELVKEDSSKKQVYPPGIDPPTVTKDPVEEIRDNPSLMEYKDPEPVGLELVIRVNKDPASPLSSFKCTLCNCFFNDDNAKLMHCKGRRHRTNYKREHDPTLKVEPPRSELLKRAKARAKKFETEERYPAKSGFSNLSKGSPQLDPTSNGKSEDRSGQKGRRQSGRPQMLKYYALPEAVDDFKYWTAHFGYTREIEQLLLAKHNSVTWLAHQYDAAEALVGHLEKSLKQVSDQLLKEKMAEMEIPEEKGRDESLREVVGIMPVGDYSSRTLVQGDTTLELVITCSVKPTVQLLEKVTQYLEQKLKDICPDQQFTIASDVEHSCFVVVTTVGCEDKSFEVDVKIYLTSLEMREEQTEEKTAKDEAEQSVLDRKWCSHALALQRRTQQFKNETEGITPIVVVMRLFKGFRRSRPEFAACSPWVIELLVAQVAHTVHATFDYMGDIFKRIFECLASGMFLPGGPGIFDPCERKPTDATQYMTTQDREDLTAASQYILRMMAFGQLKDLLGVEVPDTLQSFLASRKRSSVDYSSDISEEKKAKLE